MNSGGLHYVLLVLCIISVLLVYVLLVLAVLSEFCGTAISFDSPPANDVGFS